MRRSTLIQFMISMMAIMIMGCGHAKSPVPASSVYGETPAADFESRTLKALNGQIAMEFVLVPEDVFSMGHIDGNPDENPVHDVWLDAYWIGRFEVTAGQYAAFLNAIGRHADDDGQLFLDPTFDGALIRLNDDGHYTPIVGFEEFPAVGITWYGAKAFADWMAEETKQPVDLPTEAQWEKAAHGKSDINRIFPWGVRLTTDYARYKSTQPTKVGQYPKGVSPFGAMDMAGNAEEWVRDWYAPDYYEQSPLRNPEGPATGTLKILRGGDWSCERFSLAKLRSSFRLPTNPRVGELTMGFRVALNRAD